VLGHLGIRELGRLYVGAPYARHADYAVYTLYALYAIYALCALYVDYVQFPEYPQFPQYVRFRIVVYRCTKNEFPGNRYNASNQLLSGNQVL
jgi:hypothetical protein